MDNIQLRSFLVCPIFCLVNTGANAKAKLADVILAALKKEA